MSTYIETIELSHTESGVQTFALADRPIGVLQVYPHPHEKTLGIAVVLMLQPRRWDSEPQDHTFYIAREGENLDKIPAKAHYLGMPIHATHVWSDIPRAK